MFDESNIIVGLEIGTSKVCAVVGEQAADGALNIIGLGQSRSRGVIRTMASLNPFLSAWSGQLILPFHRQPRRW